MPKNVDLDELEQVEAELARHPEGLSISALEQALSEHVPELRAHPISRRTLQRRLERLMGARRVERLGQRKGALYRAVVGRTTVAATATPFATPDGVVAITLSRAAQSLYEYVSRPVAARTPVGYQRELLDAYQPNHTYYLPDALRKKLRALGQPIEAARAAGTFARDILSRLLIDLSWASSRLEGNTYTRLDTQRLIDFGQAAEGKDAKETQMILNHKAAIELVVEGGEGVGINAYTVLNLHALLSDNLMADPQASGRLRTRPVEFGKSVYTPLAVPQLIAEYFHQLLTQTAAITDPFEQAFFLMVHIPYLQPFEDVNKRVSRLAANVPLVQGNLCPLSFVDVPESAYVAGTLAVYELGRVELLRDIFEWAYARSCAQYVVVRDSLAEPDVFRLKHRAALTEVIGALVRERSTPTDAQIRRRATPWVVAAELDPFVQLVQQELARLHEGNIARYRVKPSEFAAWNQVR